jgi:hypothetical protein
MDAEPYRNELFKSRFIFVKYLRHFGAQNCIAQKRCAIGTNTERDGPQGYPGLARQGETLRCKQRIGARL